MDTLLAAKLLTLGVAIFMLIINVVSNMRRPSGRATARIKAFACLTLVAGVLLVIHPLNPYSYGYISGMMIVGVLIGYAAFVEIRLWISQSSNRTSVDSRNERR